MNQPYDVYANLGDPAGVLSASLAIWETRDDSHPPGRGPPGRQAASKAMDAIDGMLANLHAMRSRLIAEIRESDDENERRADELLARCRR